MVPAHLQEAMEHLWTLESPVLMVEMTRIATLLVNANAESIDKH